MDSKGRLYIPKSMRDRVGKEVYLVETPDGIRAQGFRCLPCRQLRRSIISSDSVYDKLGIALINLRKPPE
ncbi:hypothetical protein JCM16138_01480 [Thermococcus atlanticus]